MSDTPLVRETARGDLSVGALNGATTLWFVVLLAGQWAFLYFIAGFYLPPTLSGNFAAWDANPFITHGYEAGDAMGNLAFAGHVVLAAVIVFGGTIQLIPQIRARAAVIHRWNGRLFLLAAMLAAGAGLYLDVTRDILREGIVKYLPITLNGVMVLGFSALAWRAAARRAFVSHRRWALRAFMVVNGVFFLRMLVFGIIVLTRSQPSAGQFELMQYLAYFAPLLFVEAYLRLRDGSPAGRYAMAAVVLGTTVLMAAGVVGYVMIFVRGVIA